MRQWRKTNPVKARAADARRTDERRRLERQARSYVSTYLRRGRIVPPPYCDRCGQRARVNYYHPDPAKPRELLWLCSGDRRAVAAGGFHVVPHWQWPGHVEPLPTAPRWPRFAASDDRIAAAFAASATMADAPDHQRREVFAAAFFRGSALAERRAFFGAGLLRLRTGTIAAWHPVGDDRVDGELRAWVREEFRRWERASRTTAPRFETDEDRIAEREVAPRFSARMRRRGAQQRDAIGHVPVPPPLAPTVRPDARPLDDTLLEDVDARLAAFDRRLAEILARPLTPRRATPVDD